MSEANKTINVGPIIRKHAFHSLKPVKINKK
nr:MAG TPA: hypothetical protein [Caudoviricetes sp.]DAH72422.1 MAG TPA: hypothetical protein [Caudoviricetes sp.]DAZ42874.1 MAG TPA: hypothetical protein [Caudoviricetes sp.]